MEPDVVEIASPVASCSRTLTPNEAVTQEVIDVEQYEMQNGGLLVNSNVDNKNKGKAIQFGTLSYDEQLLGSASDCYGTMNNIDSYPGSSPISNSLLDPDSLIYEDDYDYPEQYSCEMEEETDDYSMYQDLFDAKDIPTGVEVTMDWFPNSTGIKTAKSSGSSKSSRVEHGIKPEGTSSGSKKAAKGSGIQSQYFFPDLATHVAQPWKALPHNSEGLIPSSAYALPRNNQAFPYSAPPLKYFSNHLQPQTPDIVMGEVQVPVPVPGSGPGPGPGPFGLLLPVPKNPSGFKGLVSCRPRVEEVISAPDSSRAKRNMEDYLGSYLFFKRFDMVEDFSDHHFASMGTTSKQHSKHWAKRIQEEWRILEKDLPEMIFVRAYESRMDLLRAVIIGAEGTPYHDGLFFFDIFFPDKFPYVPPIVHYHSGGLRINPNLYHCGKVCLSLLGTWSGSQREKWIPNNSTMLQVLVSIQGLILNQKPYFNEPGYERTAGSPDGESSSKAYSENTFLLSLKTMVYNMRRPPKYFEDFAYGHFFSCAHDVLKACNAYRNGAPVGFVLKGGVQDVEESSQSSSKKFRTDVATFVDTILLKEFILLGVLGLEAEDEDKPSETNVAKSSSSNRSSLERNRVSSK